MNNAPFTACPARLAAETLTYFPLAYMALRPMLAVSAAILRRWPQLGSSRWRVFAHRDAVVTVPGLANAFLLLFAGSLATSRRR